MDAVHAWVCVLQPWLCESDAEQGKSRSGTRQPNTGDTAAIARSRRSSQEGMKRQLCGSEGGLAANRPASAVVRGSVQTVGTTRHCSTIVLCDHHQHDQHHHSPLVEVLQILHVALQDLGCRHTHQSPNDRLGQLHAASCVRGRSLGSKWRRRHESVRPARSPTWRSKRSKAAHTSSSECAYTRTSEKPRAHLHRPVNDPQPQTASTFCRGFRHGREPTVHCTPRRRRAAMLARNRTAQIVGITLHICAQQGIQRRLAPQQGHVEAAVANCRHGFREFVLVAARDAGTSCKS
jgi:hypothetical protein